MDSRTNDILARVVERFHLYNEKTRSDNPLVASAAGKMCEVAVWEMWALTQE